MVIENKLIYCCVVWPIQICSNFVQFLFSFCGSTLEHATIKARGPAGGVGSSYGDFPVISLFNSHVTRDALRSREHMHAEK